MAQKKIAKTNSVHWSRNSTFVTIKISFPDVSEKKGQFVVNLLIHLTTTKRRKSKLKFHRRNEALQAKSADREHSPGRWSSNKYWHTPRTNIVRFFSTTNVRHVAKLATFHGRRLQSFISIWQDVNSPLQNSQKRFFLQKHLVHMFWNLMLSTSTVEWFAQFWSSCSSLFSERTCLVRLARVY